MSTFSSLRNHQSFSGYSGFRSAPSVLATDGSVLVVAGEFRTYGVVPCGTLVFLDPASGDFK